MLKRIVAMLFALAALAESAGNRPMRCLVLWILRRGEAFARAFVTDLCHDCGTAPPVDCTALPFAETAAVRSGDSADDAMRLALGFRVLAFALEDLRRYVEDGPVPRNATMNCRAWLPGLHAKARRALRVRAMLNRLTLPGLPELVLPYPDTS